MNYRKYGKDKQQKKEYGICNICLGEIYGEDYCYIIDGQLVCENCILEFSKKYFLSFKIVGNKLPEVEACEAH